MARPMRMVWLGLALIVILTVVLVSLSPSPISLTPKASTGVFLTGCGYDTSNNVLGCSYSQKTPLGQSIIAFGGSPASFRIPSAYMKINYTGQASAWAFTATELVQYDKGVSDTYPISASGSGNPQKTMNLTLPKSSWTASELQAKFIGYGKKLVNATVADCSWTFTFVNSIKVVKPCAYDYFVQFWMTYGETAVSTSTTTTTSTSTVTTSSITTSTVVLTTTISSGGVTTYAVDVWDTTILTASGGLTGNQATNGMIATVAPDYAFPSAQTVMWIYEPASISQTCLNNYGEFGGMFATLITPTQSVTMGRLQIGDGWHSVLFSANVQPGKNYLVELTCAAGSGQTLFNQVVTASSAVNGNTPPPPYDASYSQYLQTFSTTTTTTSAITGTTEPREQRVFVDGAWRVLSIVSIEF